jgi:hypothetical protein
VEGHRNLAQAAILLAADQNDIKALLVAQIRLPYALNWPDSTDCARGAQESDAKRTDGPVDCEAYSPRKSLRGTEGS